MIEVSGDSWRTAVHLGDRAAHGRGAPVRAEQHLAARLEARRGAACRGALTMGAKQRITPSVCLPSPGRDVHWRGRQVPCGRLGGPGRCCAAQRLLRGSRCCCTRHHACHQHVTGRLTGASIRKHTAMLSSLRRFVGKPELCCTRQHYDIGPTDGSQAPTPIKTLASKLS